MKSKINSFDDWKILLLEITFAETGIDKSKIKINNDEAYQYYVDGIHPYYCFREEFNK